jgi:threonine/homoserine/homoserine lactone efflux protein
LIDPGHFVRAVGLGFTIAAAVGPISVLTIRRTLAHGQAYGLASGLGVALADATYAAIAAFGLTAVTSVLVGARLVLAIAGGLVIVYLGVRTLASRPAGAAKDEERPGFRGAFASIYGLTMTNPMTILSFAALFGALGLTGRTVSDAGVLTVGVFVGSALWWVVLTAAVARLRERVTPDALTWVNRISGGVLLAFGIAAVVSGLSAAIPG